MLPRPGALGHAGAVIGVIGMVFPWPVAARNDGCQPSLVGIGGVAQAVAEEVEHQHRHHH